MKSTTLLILCVLLLAVLLSCDGDADVRELGPIKLTERSYENCPFPYDMREHIWPENYQQDADCAQESGEAESDKCRKHSECSEKPNGFCKNRSWEHYCECMYHECETDSDCKDSEACICNWKLHQAPQVRKCYVSCRSNDECGADQKCVRGGVQIECGQQFLGVVGYRCTSENDDCHGYEECKYRNKSKEEFNACVYNEDEERFACVSYISNVDGCE